MLSLEQGLSIICGGISHRSRGNRNRKSKELEMFTGNFLREIISE